MWVGPDVLLCKTPILSGEKSMKIPSIEMQKLKFVKESVKLSKGVRRTWVSNLGMRGVSTSGTGMLQKHEIAKWHNE